MERYDVIIVGAGPAGTTAARLCAEQNLKTLVLEKEKIPWKKPCAGGLSMGTLKEMDLALPDDIIERKCYGITAQLGEFRISVASKTCIAVMIRRAVFDEFLATSALTAGAIIKEESPCEEVRIESDGVIVTSTTGDYKAPIVIGADGVFSRVRRALYPPFRKRDLLYCLISEIPFSEEEILNRIGDFVELNYGYTRFGYAWVFPKKRHISYGIGGDLKSARTLKKKFFTFLRGKNINTETIKVKGCFLPISNFRHNIYGNRVLLAGDAAGLVDCFSGEGIRYAFISGKIAAETVIMAHEKNNFSKKNLKVYQRRVYTKLKTDFIWSKRVSRISFLFPDFIFGTPLREKKVIEGYLQVLSGSCSFKSFSLRVLQQLPGMILRRYWLNKKCKKS